MTTSKILFLILSGICLGSKPINTTTVPAIACTSTVSSFPYSESFESGLGAWIQSGPDNFDWTRNSGGTTSSNTGPSGAAAGSFYLYTEASNPNFPSRTAIIEGPCLNLSSAGYADFAFQFHMYGDDVGSLDFEVSLNGTTWTTLWTKSGSHGNAWITATVNLDAYAGSTIHTRFEGTTGATGIGWGSDIAIDDINVTTSAPIDTDGDGIVNTVDIDDDNDGIIDDVECNYVLIDTIRVGYFPDSRRHSSDTDYGYTLDGSHFASYGTLKMQNTSNFGPLGTVPYVLELVPITSNPITTTYIDNLNLNVIFIGDFTYGGGVIGQPSTVTNAELSIIYTWSTQSVTNLVIVSQREAEEGWGYTLSSGSTNPITPTAAGNATSIFDGAFGTVTSFNQGGSFQAKFSGGDGVVLAQESGGGDVIILDNPTGDLILSDVDILSDLGGVSAGNNINATNGNDIIFGNTWAYVVSLVTEPDTDADGALDCIDLDSDNDGIWDATEAGHGYAVDLSGRISGADTGSGANGLFDLVETVAESGTLNYAYSDSEAVPDGIYDFFENDADGDGCFDSLEEEIPDTDEDGFAGTGTPTVDGDGLVVGITYSTPTNNYWQNSSNYVVCDPDDDGLFNSTDIDDDNDGIPDTEEQTCTSATVDYYGFNLVAASGSSTSMVLGAPDGNTAKLNTNGNYLLVELENTIAIGDTYTIRWQERSGQSGTATMILYASPDNTTYTPHSFYPTTNSTSLVDVTITAEVATRYIYMEKDGNDTGGTSTDYWVDAISYSISSLSCVDRDTDGDTKIDRLDLDSDNDGIWDASEAGHTATISSGRLVGSRGTNGLLDILETPVDGGILNYTIADSETVPDGTYDAYEIDADGDTCNDTREAGVTDGDNDGIAGSGTPSVLFSGLVSGISYVAPPNTNWQNPAVDIACSATTGKVIINRHVRLRINN